MLRQIFCPKSAQKQEPRDGAGPSSYLMLVDERRTNAETAKETKREEKGGNFMFCVKTQEDASFLMSFTEP